MRGNTLERYIIMKTTVSFNELETIVNSAIRNGNQIQEAGLGTILPDKEKLKKHDRHCDNQRKEFERKASKDLSGLNKRMEQGETRYYYGENKYAIVSRSGRILWFELRKERWFAV